MWVPAALWLWLLWNYIGWSVFIYSEPGLPWPSPGPHFHARFARPLYRKQFLCRWVAAQHHPDRQSTEVLICREKAAGSRHWSQFIWLTCRGWYWTVLSGMRWTHSLQPTGCVLTFTDLWLGAIAEFQTTWWLLREWEARNLGNWSFLPSYTHQSFIIGARVWEGEICAIGYGSLGPRLINLRLLTGWMSSWMYDQVNHNFTEKFA